MNLNKSDYIQWAQSPVTEALRQHLQETLDDELAALFNHLGNDANKDQQRKGVIIGIQYLLDWAPEFEEEEEEDES